MCHHELQRRIAERWATAIGCLAQSARLPEPLPATPGSSVEGRRADHGAATQGVHEVMTCRAYRAGAIRPSPALPVTMVVASLAGSPNFIVQAACCRTLRLLAVFSWRLDGRCSLRESPPARSFSTAFAQAEALASTARSLKARASFRRLQSVAFCSSGIACAPWSFSAAFGCELEVAGGAVPKSLAGVGASLRLELRGLDDRPSWRDRSRGAVQSAGQEEEHLKVWRSNPGIVATSARINLVRQASPAPQAAHCIAHF